ncbi:hypothetical protein MVEG_12063 [Podila verticillata NRRL 6337]|uniref:Uncharacterized protein n=1 Tax=Podila verticillata NRRL 6337 TaxID=1069443 RepID=A0A086TL44_9FUNG|nr:hypothetical protein MVEG_12063 [Podila verticillata NRRL 6337]
MNPSHSSYVEYGTGNMLNIDAGTIKRKIDSNEYDDEIIQEVQPNGKRTCGNHHSSQFATFGSTPHTPNGPEHHPQHGAFNGSTWARSHPLPLLRTAVNYAAGHPNNNAINGELNLGYHTPESVGSSLAASPSTHRSMDTDMDMDSTPVGVSPMMMQSTNAMLHTTLGSPMGGSSHHTHTPMASNGLLPSALPVQETLPSTGSNEYVPVHGRSMEIPSYARVPMNEMRKYRDQRWSSCIYGADARIGQGMMI